MDFARWSLACLWASLAWQRHEVDALIEQITTLAADIAELQFNATALTEKGARIKITDCRGTLCIVASKHQSEDTTDWHGIWKNAKTGETFVIPSGY